MKKNQNHRNKLPLILASLLTLALVAYGTFAYFTDTESSQAGLQLTLGNVDIETEPTKWEYNPDNDKGQNNQLKDGNGNKVDKNSDIPSSGTGVTIVDNARPGDKFIGKITFKEVGSLDTVVQVQNDFSELGEYGPFNITVESNSEEYPTTDQGNIKLGAGETLSFNLTVEVISPDNMNEQEFQTYNTGNYSMKDAVTRWAEKAITVEAVQENYESERFTGSDQ